jgi:hypothetical protein
MKYIGYAIMSCWGPRPETPEAIAKRFLNLVDGLAGIDPVFSNWICDLDKQPVPFESIRGDLAAAVERRVSRADDGEPTPIYGYSFTAVNEMLRGPRNIGILVRAGSRVEGPFLINSAEVGTSERIVPDAAIVTYPIFRAALLVLAEAFDVTWCRAYPNDLEIAPKEFFNAGWMTYISPRFATLITPPITAIVEHRPNGALFMAATDETFVTENPKHVAVARDVQAALAPLNALPWPPDAEPE